MSLTDLYWRQSLWLILVLLPLLLMSLNGWWQRRQLQSFVDVSLLPWVTLTTINRNKRLPLYSLLIAWMFLCMALAGPRLIKQLPPEFNPDASVLIVIVDLSASMNATDVRPDRSAVAQRLLKNWLLQKHSDLAVGIVLFAGHAFELIPATTDQAVVSYFIKNLSGIHLPTAGNNLADALKLAEAELISSQHHRRLLLLTDGDMELAEQHKAAKILTGEWAGLNIQTHVIGIGETKPVTVPDKFKGLIEQENRPVLSRLEAEWLKQLTLNPAINYKHYKKAEGLELDELLELTLVKIPADIQRQVIWQEWFSLPLLFGIFFLWMSILSQKHTNQISHPIKNLVPVYIVLLLLSGYSLLYSDAYANDESIYEKARLAYKQKNYLQAQQLFSQIDTVDAIFGEASACYRVKDYDCAQRAFASVAWLSADNNIRAKAIFNLANSYFFSGDYDQAIVLYRDAELQGIDPALIAVNMSYAESMQAAMQKHFRQLRQSYQRALWKAAAAGEKVPTLTEFLFSNENYLAVQVGGDSLQQTYKIADHKIKSEIMQQFGLENHTEKTVAGRWIETERVLPQSSAAMINRLFEMELGINAPLRQPQVVEGKRKW